MHLRRCSPERLVLQLNRRSTDKIGCSYIVAVQLRHTSADGVVYVQYSVEKNDEEDVGRKK
jgi:hypothetical protein